MAKVYKNENVFDAAIKRFEIIFSEFDNYYFSVSGGKDSSIMVQLAAMVARKMGKKFSVLYIDLEAQYQETIKHIHELIECTQDVVDNWYWCALPLSLRNAVSAIQPKWICWDKKDQEKWVFIMFSGIFKQVINGCIVISGDCQGHSLVILVITHLIKFCLGNVGNYKPLFLC